MRISVLLISASLAGSAISAAAPDAPHFALKNTYDASNFFDEFVFMEGPDRWTKGFATYISKDAAISSGLAKTENGKVFLGVDTSGQAGDGGRKSVRLESKDVFSEGLMVVDFEKMPGNACGMWPAFWLLHDSHPPSSPHYSEIDLIEGISLNQKNEITMWTSEQPCNLQANAQSGKLMRTDCAGPQFDEQGARVFEASCGVYAPEGTFGDGFNGKGGGVWALLLDGDSVKVWWFERSKVPADLKADAEAVPDPGSWGIPVMNFGRGGCDVRKAWREMKIIINITFCGRYAGDSWESYTHCREKTGHETCQEFVSKNPGAFKDVHFLINGVRVFGSG